MYFRITLHFIFSLLKAVTSDVLLIFPIFCRKCIYRQWNCRYFRNIQMSGLQFHNTYPLKSVQCKIFTKKVIIHNSHLGHSLIPELMGLFVWVFCFVFPASILPLNFRIILVFQFLKVSFYSVCTCSHLARYLKNLPFSYSAIFLFCFLYSLKTQVYLNAWFYIVFNNILNTMLWVGPHDLLWLLI